MYRRSLDRQEQQPLPKANYSNGIKFVIQSYGAIANRLKYLLIQLFSRLAATSDKCIPIQLILSDLRRDNQCILSGYRSVSGSYTESLKSTFRMHNETVNIWFHLVGSTLFSSLPVVVFRKVLSRYSSAEQADITVFSTFFFGVAMFLSQCYVSIINGVLLIL